MPPANALIVELLLVLALAAGIRGGVRRWRRGSDAARSDRARGLAEAALCAAAGVWVVDAVHFGSNSAGLWAGIALGAVSACLFAGWRVLVAIERHEENERRRGFDQSPRRNVGLLRVLAWSGSVYVWIAGFFVLGAGFALAHHFDENGAFDPVASVVMGSWVIGGVPAFFFIAWRLNVAERREDARIHAEDRGEVVGAPPVVPMALAAAAWAAIGVVTTAVATAVVLIETNGHFTTAATVAMVVAAGCSIAGAVAHLGWWRRRP